MQNILDSIIDLIIEQVNINCNNIVSQREFESALEKLCEIASKLEVSNTNIGKRIPQIEELRIDAIINNLKKEKIFRVKKETKPENHIHARWYLKKYNSNNFMYIELLMKNIIYIRGSDWDLYSYGYNTLKSAIIAWTENRM